MTEPSHGKKFRPETLLLCLALALPGAVFAAEPQAPADALAEASPKPSKPPSKSKKGDKEEQVCKQEQVTGSLFARRVCRTKAESEADQRVAEEFSGGLRNTGRIDAR